MERVVEWETTHSLSPRQPKRPFSSHWRVCRPVRDGRSLMPYSVAAMGQPLEDAFVEFFIEFGYSPAEARREVEKMNSGIPNWREALN
jgi:hypothetical protein